MAGVGRDGGSFALEEQIGCCRSGRHGIHGDFAAAEFFREDICQRFDRRLGGGIDGIACQREADDAAGEVDNASARAQSLRRETKSVEPALYVDCNEAVEQRVVGICEGRPGCMMPALLTTISTPPKVSSALSKSAPTFPGAETSALTATSPRP